MAPVEGGMSVGAQPRSSVTFDGHVQVLAASGTTVYVGGEFTHATDPAGRVVARDRLAAVDARTGDLLAWNPRANKAVYAIAVDAARGTVYVGGDFSTIGATSRHRLAAVDAASGAVSAWNHQADARVRALDVSASRLYAGGQFTGVDGAPRNRLAAFSLADGRLDQAWTPAASDHVYTVKGAGWRRSGSRSGRSPGDRTAASGSRPCRPTGAPRPWPCWTARSTSAATRTTSA
jgi:hypothetical protein